jgi:FAD/FMN-containing dehydrogenase
MKKDPQTESPSVSLIAQLKAILTEQKLNNLTILLDCCTGVDAQAYEKRRQVFNTKFQFRPQAIFLVENTAQVAAIVAFANVHPTAVALRARSGGHDHEGESSGTDTWVIDFSRMNRVTLDEAASLAQQRHVVLIEPGARFEHVKAEMDKMGKNGLGIPHGTCETVCVAGFTMGGGWGPWTRRYGMGCERLIGATIVLGDGSIKVVRDTDAPTSDGGKLLWALRGGGGFSYGIVTELVFDAFDLPLQVHSFTVSFLDKSGQPDRRAIDILKDWERMVAGKNNPDLIGTNLMIVGRHLAQGQAPDPEAKLACTFNGYFAGSKKAIFALVEKSFGKRYLARLRVANQIEADTGANGRLLRTTDWHFHGWDRVHPHPLPVPLSDINVANGLELEREGPAPHKITSRLADAKGWNGKSRKALICALQSTLVAPPLPNTGPNGEYGMSQYITIGAICGPFYHRRKSRKNAIGIAFPYTKRPFTLQFQAWWDQYLDPDGQPKADPAVIEAASMATRPWANRAEDWIEACRDAHIPASSGAFISFKDDAVKTDTYFAQSYDPLKAVKADCSEDDNLLFKTRKTII